MNQRRKVKVENLIQREIANLILTDKVKDPRLNGLITITGVEMKPDMSICLVYVSVYGQKEDKKDVWAGLKSATGYIQYLMAKNLRLRIVPRIEFVPNQLEDGDRILDLIDEQYYPLQD